jgi:uncharacterized membrane protein YphA (DoxX/SURF4 family)
MKLITSVCRLLVGLLFIVSGFIKANDPLGFSYKLDEYFTVFHIPALSTISLYLAIGICAVEIALGFATLLGAKMRFVTWSLLLMILFFSFLTFYSAYFNVVKDCGCFGDALHLKPWQSFLKDVILLVLILPLFFYRKRIMPLTAEQNATGLSWLGLFLSTSFSIYCYRHLPVIDFRPYAVGKNIPEGMKVPANAPIDVYQTTLWYEKDGVVKEFTDKNYPWQDSTWKFKDSKNVLIKEGAKPAIHDFSLTDAGGSDYTEDLIKNPEYNFMLVSYDLTKVNTSKQKAINEFADSCEKAHIKFIGLTATPPTETDKIRHEWQMPYDFYFCDATALKTIIRSNPGLVLLKNGTVINMWHYNDFPVFNLVRTKCLNNSSKNSH